MKKKGRPRNIERRPSILSNRTLKVETAGTTEAKREERRRRRRRKKPGVGRERWRYAGPFLHGVEKGAASAT